MKIQRNKVVIVGAGNVGSQILYTLLSSQSIAELVIIDKNETKAVGEALDASHATSFSYSPNIMVRHGDYSDCADANIIVMTAGPSTRPGEAIDRVALTKVNLGVVKEVMTKITYQKDIQPLFNARCVACHSCFDAPAQLKLNCAEGVVRGATKQRVYDTGRLKQAQHTRLHIDAHSEEEWREKGFYPVLDDTVRPESVS